MSRIVINQFGGIAPKIDRTKLPVPLAQSARNAKTWSGSLKPFRQPMRDSALSKTGTIQTIYWYSGEVWLHWTQDVTVARNAVAGDTLEKIYFTGTDYPRVTSNDVYDDASPGTSIPPASYILGIPTPTDIATGVVGVAGNPAATYYLVFTYVRKWSDGTIDESAPSPVSAAVVAASEKITWTCLNTAGPTVANYGITHKRLYRLQSGSSTADYRYLAEITYATTTYLDNTSNTGIGDAIETTDDLPCPATMDGILSLANGVYVGFSGNTIYCSRPYVPNAYPEANQFAITGTIVGLGAFDTNVVVLTDDRVWVGSVLDPAAVNFVPLQLSRACLSKRGILSTQLGVFFPTNDGIAKVSPGGYDLVTEKLFGRDEWAAYYPSTIWATWLEDRYVGFYKTGTNDDGTYQGGGFSFDPRAGGPSTFLPLDFVAYAGYVKPAEDQLYVATKDSGLANQVEKWEGATNLFLTNEWKSPTQLVEPATTFAYALVEADYDGNISAADSAAIDAENVIARAANLARFATAFGGAVNANVVNGVDVNGDGGMLPVQDTSVSAQVGFKLYADGALFDEYTATSAAPFALVMPTGTLGPATRFEIELSSTIAVHKVAVANDADELVGV